VEILGGAAARREIRVLGISDFLEWGLDWFGVRRMGYWVDSFACKIHFSYFALESAAQSSHIGNIASHNKWAFQTSSCKMQMQKLHGFHLFVANLQCHVHSSLIHHVCTAHQ
jgi:hypothetical protein